MNIHCVGLHELIINYHEFSINSFYLSLFFLSKSKPLFLNPTNIRHINDKIIDAKNIDILYDNRIEKIKRILEQEINTNEKENNITNKVNNTEINDKICQTVPGNKLL